MSGDDKDRDEYREFAKRRDDLSFKLMEAVIDALPRLAKAAETYAQAARDGKLRG